MTEVAFQVSGKRLDSSINGTPVHYTEKVEIRAISCINMKIDFKWMKDLKLSLCL